MNKIKKIFGGINLTWMKIIVMAIIIGIYTGVVLLIPITRHTSFSDLGATFEVWIFFGIFIIMNSKSAKDSALKCFVFFLISQPLIYLVQDLVDGSSLFKIHYLTWFKITLLCIPMGYIGYYMKKDKWYSLLILLPMIVLLGVQFDYYLYNMLFSFPKHLLTVLFCLFTFFAYPYFIFDNKKNKIIGLIISTLIIIVVIIRCFFNKQVYSPDILLSGENYQFDNTCSVVINDNSLGELSINYIDNIESYSVHGDFVKEGKTTFELECPNSNKMLFDLTVKSYTYEVKIKE